MKSKEPYVIREPSAFIAINEEGEGLAGFLAGGTFMPMVCADQSRIDSMRPIAQDIANATRKSIKLVRFSVREDLETLEPAPK